MRPRLITAENDLDDDAPDVKLGASMRPRLITAENPADPLRDAEPDVASMRPRLITAENLFSARASLYSLGGFNEAAAHHRGELDAVTNTVVGAWASMRPRLITAENTGGGSAADADAAASMRPRLITAENPSTP